KTRPSLCELVEIGRFDDGIAIASQARSAVRIRHDDQQVFRLHPLCSRSPFPDFALLNPGYNSEASRRLVRPGGIMRPLRVPALCLLLLICGLSASVAQKWPDRPVRLIVPYPAGGGTDIVARVMAQK